MSHSTIDDLTTKTVDAAPAAASSRLVELVRLGAMLAATLAVGFAGGTAAKWLHFPLPYMTGSLIVTAALGLAGVPVRALWQARAAGQFVTGSAIGTSFTPALVAALLPLLPMMLLAGLLSILVGVVGALILMRMAPVEAKSAYLAAMPAGVIEMANVAVRVGADPLPIMVLQTMRVGLTVCVAPFLVTFLADDGTRHEVVRAATMSWLTVGMLMLASFAGGLVLRVFKMPNGWFLGSILTVATIGAFGLVEGRVPDALLVAAQVIIGASIGTQFKHEFLTRLLRLLLASLVTVPFSLLAMGLLGLLFAVALQLPLATMMLSLAPAGIAEMALTGKVLGLDAPMITVFHLGRIVIVLLSAQYACRLFERLVTRKV
jgi:membrane AbrB-like protein